MIGDLVIRMVLSVVRMREEIREEESDLFPNGMFIEQGKQIWDSYSYPKENFQDNEEDLLATPRFL